MAGERFCSAVWAQEQAIQLFPSPGIILQNPQQTFRWDSISGVDFFEIQIGSEVGVSDIYSQSLTDETVVTVKEIPLTGAPLYVRLWWKKDGMWEFADFKYATVKADAGAGGAGAAAANYVTVAAQAQGVSTSVAADKQETQAHIVSSRSAQQNNSSASALQQDHQEETTISLQAKRVSTVTQPAAREASTASAGTAAIQQGPIVSTQTINFKEGYNYFSVYVASSMTVGEIIDTVGLTQRIFYWNGSRWAGVNPNETLLPRVGYVVLAEKPGSVELSGEQSKEYILDLKKGWNLVGAPVGGVKQSELLPYDVMQGPVWGWGNGGYVTTEDLQHGQSYWIYAKYDTQLTISRKGNKSKPQIFVKNIEYNATGQMTRIEYGNGVITEYTYNPLTLRLDRIHTVNAKGEAIQDFKYRYDSAGNILEIQDDVNTASQSFKYDEQNRLVEANGEYYGLKSFVYDKIGNIVKKDGLSYVYGESGAGPHAVTSLSDGTQIRYDANGNMVSKIKGNETWEYGYDAENRLQEVKKNGVKLSEYEYDGDGGRTKKIVYKEGRGPEVTTFIGSLTEESNNRITNFIYVGGKRIAALTNGDTVFYHDDHLGGTNVITDDKGAKKELIEYLPYGKKSHDEKYGDTKEVAWHYFTGHREDDESGLYYFGARYYDPELGRFITPDTIVQDPYDPQTLNRYSYVSNNPVNRVDLDGHKWSWTKFWHAAIGAIVAAVAIIVLGPAGVGLGMWAAGAIGGALGGAITGGLDGGWKGALMGGLAGGALGGLGGWVGGIASTHGMGGWFIAGSITAGGGYAAATDNLDSFAGGLVGGLAGWGIGNGIVTANKEQFANLRAGSGFKTNAEVAYAAKKSLDANGKGYVEIYKRGLEGVDGKPHGLRVHPFLRDSWDGKFYELQDVNGKIKILEGDINDMSKGTQMYWKTGPRPDALISVTDTDFNVNIKNYMNIYGNGNTNYEVIHPGLNFFKFNCIGFKDYAINHPKI